MSAVTCTWHTEDVLEVNDKLTKRQANAVLLLACVFDHDADTGVNWDVLAGWVGYVLEHPEVVDRVHKDYGHRLVEAV